jgi:phage terminase large subunit-like protein
MSNEQGQSKVQRLQSVIGRFKASEVIVLDRQPWTADFREELLQFPYGRTIRQTH